MHCPLRANSNIEPLCYMGHPRSHLVLFSFGVLKFCTALGGGVAKIADDALYATMLQLYRADPIQDSQQYSSNVKKYFYLYWLLNSPYATKFVMCVVRLFKLNHMEFVVQRLRAFAKQPSTDELFRSLRRQPCRPLLAFLHARFQHYDYRHLAAQRDKAMYVLNKLERNPAIQFIGLNSTIKNFWLFPIIVSKADLFAKLLSKHHVDAYRGTTQLNVITKPLTDTDTTPLTVDPTHRCPNAEYLIDHVIYLPVHAHVPQSVLDQLIIIVNQTARQIDGYALRSKL